MHCIRLTTVSLFCTHAQGVKQLVCPSVVVGTKITRSQIVGICACCKHNELVDIGEKLVSTCFELRLTCTTNCAFSVQHTGGLSTTPTVLVCADVTAHA